MQFPEINVTGFQTIGIYELSQEWLDRSILVLPIHDKEHLVIAADDVPLVMEVPMERNISTNLFQRTWLM